MKTIHEQIESVQIATNLVEACPGTGKMTSAQRALLAGTIAEELSKQRQEGYATGYECGINADYYNFKKEKP